MFFASMEERKRRAASSVEETPSEMATMRTSSRLRSRAAKSAFSAAPESHRWAPTARIASSRRKKSSRDTRLGGFAGDEEQPVEHDIFVECVRQGKVWRDFMRGPA